MKAELRGQEDTRKRKMRAVEITLDRCRKVTYDDIMKSEIFNVRLKINDTPMVRKAARRAGLSISAYIRSCVMEDFRTMCDDGARAQKMNSAIAMLIDRMDKMKMGAGLQPVPPTPGATSTHLATPTARKKRRERGTS
jgi:hypothetical protein